MPSATTAAVAAVALGARVAEAVVLEQVRLQRSSGPEACAESTEQILEREEISL